MTFRSSLRLRLAAWYAGIFLLGGAALVGAAYGLARHNVGPVRAVVHGRTDRPAQLLPQRRVDRNAWRQTLDQLALVLGALTALSLGAGWLVAGRALRPLQQITETAQRLSETNLGERIALRGPDDELKRLADSLDEMLARLDDVVSSHRRFIADASHELRTPLAVMRAAVEVSLTDPDASEDERREAGATIVDSVRRSDHLVQSLLALARSEAAAETRFEVDLAELVEGALTELRPEVDAQRLAVETSVEPAVVRGDGALLRTLVLNLLRNAVDHNRARGELSVEVRPAGERARLLVGNTGAVVLPDEVEDLFEPFRRGRGADSTTGAGLGLAIARSVVERHHGSLNARARELGGLEVELELPLAAASAGPPPPGRRPRRRSLADASRVLLLLVVITAAFVVVAYAAVSSAAFAVRAGFAHTSDAQAERGRRAFPLVPAGISERTLRRVAGAPTWAGRSAHCSVRLGGRLARVPCRSGDRCLVYGDVDSDAATEFCFRGGLVWKLRWREDAWRALVNAKPAGA
jgi:signal transduction histidine kinase